MLRRIPLVLALLAVGVKPVSGQAAVRLVGGAVLGGAVSIPVTMAYVTYRAHTGDYIFNGSEGLRSLVWIPAVLVGATTGVAVVSSDRFSLPGAAAGTVAGGLAGALIGRGIAGITASTDAGRWAGLVIGMGIGVVVGTVSGGLIGGASEADDSSGSPAVSVSIPLRLF